MVNFTEKVGTCAFCVYQALSPPSQGLVTRLKGRITEHCSYVILVLLVSCSSHESYKHVGEIHVYFISKAKAISYADLTVIVALYSLLAMGERRACNASNYLVISSEATSTFLVL